MHFDPLKSMFLEHEITCFSHKKDLIACFPEGIPRAFTCVGRPACHGKPQACRLLSRLLWYNRAIRYDKVVSTVMIKLYHLLSTHHDASVCHSRSKAYATTVA